MPKENAIYQFRDAPGLEGQVQVLKLNEDYEPFKDIYNISIVNGKPSRCNCWQGKKWCRHKQMYEKFAFHGRINTGWFYSFDKDLWIQPLTQES